MNGPRLVVALVAGFIAALALGGCLGCGGGDSSPEISISVPTETQATLTKAEFIKEADTICKDVNDSIAQYVEQGQGLSAAGEIADLRAGLASDLQDLGIPSEDQATAEQVIQGYQDQSDAGGKIALALDRGEDTAAAESELASAKAATAEAASSYGFEECGQEPSATGSSSGTASGGTSGGVTPSAPAAPAPAAPATPTPPAPSGGGGGISPG